MQSLNISVSSGTPGKGSLTGSLGINSSSDDGLSLQPSVSFSTKSVKNGKTETSLSGSVGCSFSSRGGLQALTIQASVATLVARENKKAVTYSGGTPNSSFNLGMPTYTPKVDFSMHNLSITANFKLGGAAFGVFGDFAIGGYYSGQKLVSNVVSNPAYGYMNADEGTKYPNALLDFNRENDGPFTPSTPALAIPNFTYDIYSVSGQGVEGSYRPFRSDLGHVFDPSTKTTSDGYSLGVELGLGDLLHVGADFTVNTVNGASGDWTKDNTAGAYLTNKASTGDPLYEKYYFKEANEKSVDPDPVFYASAGGDATNSILLNQLSSFHTIADHYYAQGEAIPSANYRTKRERRKQPLTIITRDELSDFGLEVEPGILEEGSSAQQAKGYHIAEITTLRNDGARYVYGLAAYNTSQEETTFAVGTGANTGRTGNVTTGLVNYVPGLDNSSGNTLGLDNYYSNTTMPAYAHSYLLTAVLSPDYVDSDTSRGPSDGDIGNYTKFNYATKIADYNWRVPVEQSAATFNEGLKSDITDDKANYIYGKKDLFYLTSIETKNYIAVFSLEDRKDGYGVIDKNGGRASSNPMKLLRKISLYTKPAYKSNPLTAVPIKEVHFEYDYSLCPNVPNNANFGTTTDNGKLTLKKIYFTYQNSNKARLSPYQFSYSSFNPSYNIKGYDRWGNYKPDTVTSSDATFPGLSPAEYPYVDQNKNTADLYMQAWSLTQIGLPSGGQINLDYESDDYAYVQNVQAGQMFQIVDLTTDKESPTINNIGYEKSFSPPITDQNPFDSNPADNHRFRLYFKLQEGADDINEYISGIDNLYFRFLMDIKPGVPLLHIPSKYEYVSGYAQIVNFGKVEVSGNSDTPTFLGWVELNQVRTNDDEGSTVNPIVKAAIQYGRLNLPRVVWNSTDIDETVDGGSFGKDLLVAMINSSFVKNISDAILGLNEALYIKPDYHIGRSAIMGKSWIRLNNPNKQKLGGGSRVKKIAISDEWNGAGISENAPDAFDYGQEYTYTLKDGTSSGVASYEPQLGGDENSLHQPIAFDVTKLLVPDDHHYMETPFGESFFPSPGVGYSCVTVKNLQRAGVTHNATGKVVHQFYTAKDYPTIATYTAMKPIREKTNPFSLSNLFHIAVRDYMTASQGYLVELNDMHGKPKKQEVYQEGQTTPITSVEYRYKSSPYMINSKRLDNTSTVLYSNGTVDSTANLGVFFDFVSDMRESTNQTVSAALQGNNDDMIIPPFPIIIPITIGLPSFTQERTQFRSAVITKVIQRFGILEETIATDLGSIVSTKDLAYDAETGDVLLTQTTTDYNDKVYSLTYPAYWYYDGMGAAYKNIGFNKAGITFSNGSATVSNALTYFAEGDEIALSTGSTDIVAWVISVGPNTVQAVDRSGSVVSGSFIRVLRSGRRNQQGVPMASITSLSNPLTAVQSNNYDNVLQAQAMEFTNGWKTFCDCFNNSDQTQTSNPYVLGIKGMYKNKKSYLYLTGRTQSNYDNNTNIRKDGVFTSYNPFYKMSDGNWVMDSRNWTFTSEVTEFSPFGAELENVDALGRYSAATYGYNQTFPTAVAANSRYSDIGFDNFEDYSFSACADNHFKFNNYISNVSQNQSHTGRNSIKVMNGTPVNMTKQLLVCDSLPCNLQLLSSYNATTKQYSYTISGGTPPYQFDWTATGCDLIVSIADSGNGVNVSAPSAGSCQFILSVIDKNNCNKLFTPITLLNH